MATAHEVWRSFAHERRMHHFAEPGLAITGRYDGIEVSVRVAPDQVVDVVTRVEAAPRLALAGSVRVERASGWAFLRGLRSRAPLAPDFAVTRSSESVARAVLDDRVVRTVRALGARLVELVYTSSAIALAWQGIEHDPAVLDDAVSCVAYLAAAVAATPYR